MATKTIVFTPEQVEWLKEHYYGQTYAETSRQLNEKFGLETSADKVKRWCYRNGLSNGVCGLFKKGHESLNKGRKTIYRTEEQQAKARSTQYKPGHKPVNTYPIGTKKVLKDGYVWVKISDKPKAKKKRDNWIQEHIHIWEQANGPLPPHHRIVHINQIKTDNRLENLICVKIESVPYMIKHGLNTTDPELIKTNLIMAEVSAKISQQKRAQKNKGANGGNGKKTIHG